MPELVNFICTPDSLKDLESKLELIKFESLERRQIDPTIRRICDRAAEDESKLEQLEYGIVTDEKGRAEYCGVSRADLKITIVDRNWVKKRRDWYEAYPLPTLPGKQSRFVQRLIFETVEKWSSPDPDCMGASYAQIYLHVADYSNIEIDDARFLVDRELPNLEYLEKSVGDHWRIKPHLMADRSKAKDIDGA